jgi:general secretion pathway protein G
MNGRRLAILLGVIMVLGAVYGTGIIRGERTAHFQRATALKDNLATLRNAIDAFREAEGRYPRTLEELIPKYLRRMPVDPVTHSTSTWRLTTEETVQPSTDFGTATTPKTEKYIVDVHSGAPGTDADGIAYADY